MASADAAGPWSQGAAVVGNAYSEWRELRTIRLGAGLAYYGLLAAVPVLSLWLALLSLVVDDAEIESAVAEIGGDLLDADQQDQLATAISQELNDVSTQSALGIFALASMLVTGSLVLVAFSDAVNAIWRVPAASGVGATLRRRLRAVLVLLSTTIVLTALLIVRLIGGVVGSALGSGSAPAEIVGVAADRAIWVASLAAVVALLFRVFSPTGVRLWSVGTGAVSTAAVLVIGNDLVGLYLDRVASLSVVGAAGGLAVSLLWLYGVAQILLAGVHLVRSLETSRRPS